MCCIQTLIVDHRQDKTWLPHMGFLQRLHVANTAPACLLSREVAWQARRSEWNMLRYWLLERCVWEHQLHLWSEQRSKTDMHYLRFVQMAITLWVGRVGWERPGGGGVRRKKYCPVMFIINFLFLFQWLLGWADVNSLFMTTDGHSHRHRWEAMDHTKTFNSSKLAKAVALFTWIREVPRLNVAGNTDYTRNDWHFLWCCSDPPCKHWDSISN
jgi:hypothetical protein